MGYTPRKVVELQVDLQKFYVLPKDTEIWSINLQHIIKINKDVVVKLDGRCSNSNSFFLKEYIPIFLTSPFPGYLETKNLYGPIEFIKLNEYNQPKGIWLDYDNRIKT